MALGKKNHVKLDPLAYNICLLGESKIGKTTLIYEVCKKLAGDDGYIFAEIGLERGADAIEGINYVNCPEWDMPYDEDTNSVGFSDLVDDIVDNKSTEYQNLKVVVWDTYDQLINIAEDKSIALWNRANPDKKTSSINAAWGGYGRGEKKAIELMFTEMARLRSVGVATIIIGHVKTKDVTDIVSGDTYQILTSDQQQNYFNPLKKNLHVLALGCIDREIIKEKTDKKDPNTKKDKFIGKIASESRVIKFRDDNYSIDAGGRFAGIVSEIPFTSDAFIKAITDAILVEQSKSGKTLEETKQEQDAQQKKLEKKVQDNEISKKEEALIKEIVAEVITFIKNDGTKYPNAASDIMAICTKNGFENPTTINKLAVAQELKQYIDSKK